MWDGEEIYPFLSEIELEKGCSIIKYLQFFFLYKILIKDENFVGCFFFARENALKIY